MKRTAALMRRLKKIALLAFFVSGQLIGFNRITSYDFAGRLSDVRMGANPCYQTFSAALLKQAAAPPAKDAGSLAPRENRVQVGDFEKAVSRQDIQRPLAAAALLAQAPPPAPSLFGRVFEAAPLSKEQSPVVPFHLNSKK